MQLFTLWLQKVTNFLWSGPILILLIFVGAFLTLKLKGIQFRYLPHALGLIFKPLSEIEKDKSDHSSKGDISSFQAVMTALAGAIGTGNITGIAVAVTTGGFGALFWMWVLALFGMATAYAESVLAVKFRDTNAEGHVSGGPMYTLLNALKSPKMAAGFALFGALASLMLGSLVQANSVVDAVEIVYPMSRLMIGLILAGFLGAVVLGGIESIGRVAGVLVPLMAMMYLGAGLFVLIDHAEQLIPALVLIIQSAFTGQAAAGGFLGASFLMAIRMGASNGIFANEAGLGSLAIAAASAKVAKPAKQGMYSISGVFVSTMVICTITGLVLAVTQVLGSVDASGKVISGSPLAMLAFSQVLPELEYVVVAGLLLFAFTTMLAWAYYGEKCIEFLLGLRAAHLYRFIYTGVTVLGAMLDLELVWTLAHFSNALMAPFNLYALLKLSDIVSEETKIYLRSLCKNGSLN